jgi:predicted Zn-dependent protease
MLAFMTRFHKALRYLMVTVFALCLIVPPAMAQLSGPIIRDTEIERTLESWLEPLLKAADMDSGSVRIILVNSPQVNAFVAGGANIFIYTGLIEKTENPGELVAVMAHELGHIAGGHLISLYDASERASYESILGVVLGGAAAILTGDGRAASAISLGAQGLAAQRFLSHTRLNESSADQAALRFLNDAEINPEGLESFFETLEDQEFLPASQQSEYMRTHPLTRNRIESVKQHIESSPHRTKAYPAAWSEKFNRMKAKLAGFIHPERVLWDYNEGDQSFAAQYAHAIAAYQQNDIESALKRVNGLIEREPKNPYLYELKGQMLLEYGRVEESIEPLEQSVNLAPNAGLIRAMLGHALIEAGGENNLRAAIDHLEFALQKEPRSARVRRLLATAYGRTGQEIKARLNLAEEASLQGRRDAAKRHAGYVIENSPAGSREALKAQDLLNYLKETEPRNKK